MKIYHPDSIKKYEGRQVQINYYPQGIVLLYFKKGAFGFNSHDHLILLPDVKEIPKTFKLNDNLWGDYGLKVPEEATWSYFNKENGDKWVTTPKGNIII
jgi:hypothetical protein